MKPKPLATSIFLIFPFIYLLPLNIIVILKSRVISLDFVKIALVKFYVLIKIDIPYFYFHSTFD
ncbi:MAG: hypothetical protein ACXAAM_08140, partial [Candidatus Heimdallarchaeaceae archaeon]